MIIIKRRSCRAWQYILKGMDIDEAFKKADEIIKNLREKDRQEALVEWKKVKKNEKRNKT